MRAKLARIDAWGAVPGASSSTVSPRRRPGPILRWCGYAREPTHLRMGPGLRRDDTAFGACLVW